MNDNSIFTLTNEPMSAIGLATPEQWESSKAALFAFWRHAAFCPHADFVAAARFTAARFNGLADAEEAKRRKSP